MTLTVDLVSPEAVLYEGEAAMVVARTTSGGDIAFQSGHQPFLGGLGIWPVRLILEDGGEERFAVHGGFVEVSGDRVIVLSDVAEVAEEIDVERGARRRPPPRRLCAPTPTTSRHRPPSPGRRSASRSSARSSRGRGCRERPGASIRLGYGAMMRLTAVPIALAALVLMQSSGCSSGDGAATKPPGDAPEATVPGREPEPQAPAVPRTRDLSPYGGLGTWVDAYDYAPAFTEDGRAPVVPGSVDDMAAVGVKTLYLQASKDDDRSPGMLVDEALVERFLLRAHERGVRVVAWFLPRLADVDADVARLEHLLAYEVGGHRFDGVAVDIEWTQSVPDTATRNERLLELSERVGEAAAGDPLGAIVFPPVATEVVNPALWPAFPYRSLSSHYQVWMTMGYWTFRSEESGYRSARRYTDENIRRLRANLGDSEVPVHPIGGIGDLATRADYEGFVTAARENGALGWSVYDFLTTSSAAWPALRPPRA